MNLHQSLVRIKAIATLLGELNKEVVFVGGATVALYVPEPAASETRPTDDVDIVVEIATYADYTQIEKQLLACGFQQDVYSPVICRYKVQGIIVDVMTTINILGFSNRWYPEGFKTAIEIGIDQQTIIKIFSVGYFIASKIEAFRSRGNGDYRLSTDFEDIVYIFENRKTIQEDLETTNGALRVYLQGQFRIFLADKNIEEGISAHLTPRFAAQKLPIILKILQKYIE